MAQRRRRRGRSGNRPAQNENAPRRGSGFTGSLAADVDPQVRSRGERYFQQGRVTSPNASPQSLKAEVRGKGGNYNVTLEMAIDEARKRSTVSAICDCPYFTGGAGHCKHIWAVICHADGVPDCTFKAPTEHPISFFTRSIPVSRRTSKVVTADPNAASRIRAFSAGGHATAEPGDRGGPQSRPHPSHHHDNQISWREALKLVGHAQRDIAESKQRAAGVALSNDIFYVVDTAATRKSGQLTVQLFHVSAPETETAGRLVPLPIDPRGIDQVDSPADREILACFFGVVASSVVRSAVRDPALVAIRPRATSFVVADALRSGLLESMAATGRFGWLALEEAELEGAVFDKDAFRPVSWDAQDAWNFRLAVAVRKQDRSWIVRGELRRGRITVPLRDALAVFPDGSALLKERVARIELPDPRTAGWISTLRQVGAIKVPKADQSVFLRGLVDLAGAPPIDLPHDSGWTIVTGEPRPKLVFLAKSIADRALVLMANYDFDYVVPASLPQRKGRDQTADSQLVPESQQEPVPHRYEEDEEDEDEVLPAAGAEGAARGDEDHDEEDEDEADEDDNEDDDDDQDDAAASAEGDDQDEDDDDDDDEEAEEEQEEDGEEDERDEDEAPVVKKPAKKAPAKTVKTRAAPTPTGTSGVVKRTARGAKPAAKAATPREETDTGAEASAPPAAEPEAPRRTARTSAPAGDGEAPRRVVRSVPGDANPPGGEAPRRVVRTVPSDAPPVESEAPRRTLAPDAPSAGRTVRAAPPPADAAANDDDAPQNVVALAPPAESPRAPHPSSEGEAPTQARAPGPQTITRSGPAHQQQQIQQRQQPSQGQHQQRPPQNQNQNQQQRPPQNQNQNQQQRPPQNQNQQQRPPQNQNQQQRPPHNQRPQHPNQKQRPQHPNQNQQQQQRRPQQPQHQQPQANQDQGPRVVLRRDRQREEALIKELLETTGVHPSAGRSVAGADVFIDAAALTRIVSELSNRGWAVEAEGQKIRVGKSFNVDVKSGMDWLNLRASFDFGDGATVGMPKILEAVRRGEDRVQLGDGTVGLLPEAWLKNLEPILKMGEDGEGGELRYRQSQAAFLDVLVGEAAQASVDAEFAAYREKLKSLSGIGEATPDPEFIGELRPYQRHGLGWLEFLDEFNFGGCLADDMGLGKTVQVLAHLQKRRRAAKKKPPPSLIVAPTSLIHNWVDEARRFTPDLKVSAHVGATRHRSLKALAPYDIVVTSYGTMRSDVELFAGMTFDYIVLDEAQAIKNETTQSAKAARALQGARRLAMSGTPVENRLAELGSIFRFLNPGMLDNSTGFAELFSGAGKPSAGKLETLAKVLRPFILRRTKTQVLPDLPQKTENTIFCVLEDEQRKEYDQLAQHFRDSLQKKIKTEGLGKSRMHVLEALLRLRQLACHPGLIDQKRVEEPSAKMDLLDEMLEEAVASGHKSLVFSQFTSMLAIVRARLDAKGIKYEYLDGSTRDRKERVEHFQTDDTVKVFLISLKAGGVGLNLTAADYCFILDPWWNPASEQQAIDRAHRIGQKSHVFAYRLIARGTVEEKILELQAAKRKLAEGIIADDGDVLSDLTSKDLDFLLG